MVERCRSLFLFVCLWTRFPASVANLMIWNDGYCDMVVETENKTMGPGKFPQLIHAQTAKKLLGFAGPSTLAVYLRPRSEKAVMQLVAPEGPPGKRQRTFEVPDFTGRMALFHELHIPAKGDGWDCSHPLAPAEEASSLLTLILPALFLLVLAVSWALGGSNIRPWETGVWIAITVYFYVQGMLSVYRLSNSYLAYCKEVGIGTCDVHGDRVWGLYDDTNWLNQVFGGRRWDRKDLQTRELVANFPSILAFVVFYLLLKALLARASKNLEFTGTLLLGVGYVCFLHEFTILQPLSYALLNYAISRLLVSGGRLGRALLVPCSWLLGILALAAAGRELSLETLFRSLSSRKLQAWGRWMDRFQGELSWFSVLRFWVLRCISWTVDFSRSLDTAKTGTSVSTGVESNNSGADHKHRADASRPLQEYKSLSLYAAYLLYPPVYMTGPIISFNAFASYMEQPQVEFQGWALARYWLRWLLDTFLFIAFGHFLYTSALAVNGPLVSNRDNKAVMFDNLLNFGLDGETMIWFSFWSLKGLWFKFLVIWRFARGWALSDGVAAMENMERCMCNNYSVRDFWRGWHRSFNRWLVRYVYVPLGGSGSFLRQLGSTAVVFTFVAIWHEPTLLHLLREEQRLLVWGWLLALFVVPELAAERFCSLPRWKAWLDEHPTAARHMRAFGGACSIQMLIIANLVGYSYGLKGASYLLLTVSNPRMWRFLAAFVVWLFAKTQLMLIIRQHEARAADTAERPKLASKSKLGKDD